MSRYSKPTSKSNLRLVAGHQQKGSGALKLAGFEPSPQMRPGTYKAMVTSTEIVWKFNRNNARLFFRVLEGEFSGTSLEGWFAIDMVGDEVKPGCRYHRLCQLACADEEPTNFHPAHVFKDKVFSVSVRYRRSDGKSRRMEDDSIAKGDSDKLRVGTIIAREEL
jgi:hypothetical protein